MILTNVLLMEIRHFEGAKYDSISPHVYTSLLKFCYPLLLLWQKGCFLIYYYLLFFWNKIILVIIWSKNIKIFEVMLYLNPGQSSKEVASKEVKRNTVIMYAFWSMYLLPKYFIVHSYYNLNTELNRDTIIPCYCFLL